MTIWSLRNSNVNKTRSPLRLILPRRGVAHATMRRQRIHWTRLCTLRTQLSDHSEGATEKRSGACMVRKWRWNDASANPRRTGQKYFGSDSLGLSAAPSERNMPCAMMCSKSRTWVFASEERLFEVPIRSRSTACMVLLVGRCV
jgi:hypothetical protein